MKFSGSIHGPISMFSSSDRSCGVTWFAPADVEAAATEEVPWSMRVPGLILAGACLVLGVTPIAVELAAQAARALLS